MDWGADGALVYHTESGDEPVHQVESAKAPAKRVSHKNYHLIGKRLIASYRRVCTMENRAFDIGLDTKARMPMLLLAGGLEGEENESEMQGK